MSPAVEICADRLQQAFGAQVLCDLVGLDEDPASLLGPERVAIARAVPRRQAEFAAGRRCARRLLAQLGFEAAPLLPAADRSPLWPPGAIGSIAHSARLCAVAVARAGELVSLGLDIEPDEPLEAGLWPSICTPGELAALDHRSPADRGRAARVVFSAKECVYKCAYPRLRTALEFHDVELELLGPDRFRARLRPRPSAQPIEGFVLRCEESILTGAVLASTWDARG